MSEYTPIQFLDQPIRVEFDTPPVYEKTPACPPRFIWQDVSYQVVESLSEWADFTRKGRSARNMRPSNALAAAGRGSLGVGRFFFRVRVQTGQIFDIYYDRAPKDSDDNKGAWVIYRELGEKS